MLYNALRFVLFRLDAERSHNLTLTLLNAVYGSALVQPWLQRLQSNGWSTHGQQSQRQQIPISCMGLEFPSAVGLAAGLDKNGDYINGLGTLGFGFIEIGTVTPRPQAGNPKPRLFRLPEETAIINRMGFNNKGVDYLVERVKQRRYPGILGINIGKNADTAPEDAVGDYLYCLRKVYLYADYIAVNISSPNTPGLRDLQHGTQLTTLFAALKSEQADLTDQHGRYTPIACKIAPDMNDKQIEQFADAALGAKIDAVIATNTTFAREGVANSKHRDETGGLSGAPLTRLATHTVARLSDRLAGRIPIIGAGGIVDAATGIDKLAKGATLIQLYTGLIYQGPALIRSLNRAIKQT